jgi:hypothetical protein
LAAIFGGYAAGLLSLSRIAIEPTYMVPGMAAAYLGMVATDPPVSQPRFSIGTVFRMIIVSVLFLVASQVFVKTFLR